MQWRFATLLIALVLSRGPLESAEPAPERVDYARAIKPIFKSRCYACHGALKQEAGLRLDTGPSIRRGSDHGNVIAPGAVGSALVERIRSDDKSHRMPPEGESLTIPQINSIIQWIEQGAISPEGEQPEIDPRLHWAFQLPVRPEVPRMTQYDRIQNPIDAFIAFEHQRHQLHAQPRATKQALLRRVFLDLIGLPPTRDELHAFLDDDEPDAFVRVVERLLNSPLYGERWGRHWMDIWRYSDWFGRRYVPDVWNSAPQIWRWRDWIVKSLNDNHGYDQMVAEMLAADEISPENAEAGYATGYLIRNWYALNPNDWMRSNVEHTGKAFLGLTFNCAHCHDHKYDPISQDDYFRFRAFFEPISIRQERVPGEADPGPFQEYEYSTLRKVVRLGAVRIFDKTLDAPTWFYTGGDERNRVTSRGSMAAGIPAFLAASPFTIAPVKLPPRAWYPGLQPSIQNTIASENAKVLAATRSQLSAARVSVAAVLPVLQAKLDSAESEFDEARQRSKSSGRHGVLAGQQSLLIDATTGRRLVQNRLQNVKSFGDGTSIRFQMQIVKDAHVNFQLAKDVVKGLTAGYVAFENGRILSYQPGSFNDFEVGRYDFAAGQTRFEVELVFRESGDCCLLTIRSLNDGAVVTREVPVAKNGWNPVGDVSKGILFDVHTGAVAAFDELTLFAPRAVESPSGLTPERLAYFDFEPPIYADGRDLIGVDGWFGSTFSVAGATSFVTSTLGDESLKPLAQKRNLARTALEAQTLKLDALQAKQEANLAEMESMHARIAADSAKYGELHDVNSDQLARTASQKYRTSSLLSAEAELLGARQKVAEAESLALGDANRAKEVEKTSQQLTISLGKVEKAREAINDPSQATTYPGFSPTYPTTSTGRRRALAEWIASRNNPLTARVAVNHIWLRHFHSPLVATVSDFGRNGALPSHPALLDWLAVELMESGWSMKHLHRMIVTSDAYAMSTGSGPETRHAREFDPENRLLWRMNAGRMESEAVRDSLLSVAGLLDLHLGGQELENSQALTTRRRTLYYSCQPEIDGKSPLGALFDAPESAECYRRTNSIIPQQALALTNSDLVHELSGILHSVIWRSLSPAQQTDNQSFIVAAYEQILTRNPTDAEMSTCQGFLAHTDSDGADPIRVRESLVRALLNHNDFVATR